MTPAVLLFGAEEALSDEPGRIVVQEEPDLFANRPSFRGTTLELLHPRTYYYVRDKLDGTINRRLARLPFGSAGQHLPHRRNCVHLGADCGSGQ